MNLWIAVKYMQLAQSSEKSVLFLNEKETARYKSFLAKWSVQMRCLKNTTFKVRINTKKTKGALIDGKKKTAYLIALHFNE